MGQQATELQVGLGILRMLAHGILKDLHFFRARGKFTLAVCPRRLFQPPSRSRLIVTQRSVPGKVIKRQTTALGRLDCVDARCLHDPTRLIDQTQFGEDQTRFQQFEVIFADERTNLDSKIPQLRVAVQ